MPIVGIVLASSTKGSIMQVLNSIGSVANGWAKFVVTLLAIGWFGVYALNEIRPGGGGSQSKRISDPVVGESELAQATESSQSISAHREQVPPTDMDGQPPSIVDSLGSELWASLSKIFGAKLAQLTLAFASGAGVGLVARPALNRFSEQRRLAAARKRLQSLEEDRKLLAMAGELALKTNPDSAAGDASKPLVEAVQSPRV